jgi:hypothetical protein
MERFSIKCNQRAAATKNDLEATMHAEQVLIKRWLQWRCC